MLKDVLVVGNPQFAEEVGATVEQFSLGVEAAQDASDVRRKSRKRGVRLIIFDRDSYAGDIGRKMMKALKAARRPYIVVTADRHPRAVLEARDFGATDCIIKPYNKREFITHFNAIVNKKVRLACIGGGTGLLNILMGLKSIPGVLLTSIVSNTDDGGSSGRLKASFGILPPGDIRRSLIALSNAPALMNQVMQHRFDRGGELKGHNFGNLFLTTLAEIKGSMTEAVKELADILYIQGIVLPIATAQTTLCAQFEDGTVIKGESKIDLAEGRDPALHIKKLWHEPVQECDIDAYSCILNADIVTIGPGDLFTSVITNLITNHVGDAMAKSKAKKVYICNLMTKPGETAGFTSFDHVREIVRYLGGDYLDYIIISNTRLSEKAIAEYARMGQVPVGPDTAHRLKEITKARVIVADVSHETELVRHDEQKIRDQIHRIIAKECLS